MTGKELIAELQRLEHQPGCQGILNEEILIIESSGEVFNVGSVVMEPNDEGDTVIYLVAE